MTGSARDLPAHAPEDIEKLSFSIIDREVGENRPFSGPQWRIVRRMIHTTADFELPELTVIHPDAVEAGVSALASGATIVTDTEMARCGIPLRRTQPLGCEVRCLMNDPEVVRTAREKGTTRARAAVDVALETIRPRIWVIGNAPTALIRLLEHLEDGAPPPALIVGMPVGFVNAAESKELLLAQDLVPFVTIRGRKGGSALAATVVNSLIGEVNAQRT